MGKMASGEPDRCVPKVRSRLVFLMVVGAVNVALCLLFGIAGSITGRFRAFPNCCLIRILLN